MSPRQIRTMLEGLGLCMMDPDFDIIYTYTAIALQQQGGDLIKATATATGYSPTTIRNRLAAGLKSAGGLKVLKKSIRERKTANGQQEIEKEESETTAGGDS